MFYIRRILEHVIDAAASGNVDLCILMESKTMPDRWMQITYDTINATYPFSEPPMEKVRALELPIYRALEVVEWEPKTFATFDHGIEELDQVAAFVAAYFEKVLGVNAAEQDVRVEEQQL